MGQRIRELRSERRVTAERLAFESELGSKGFLSDIERGRARPSIATLQVIADYLEVLLVDLFTFPERSEREKLIDRTRWLTPGATRKLLNDMPNGPARPPDVGTSSGAPGVAKSRSYPHSKVSQKKLTVAEPTTAALRLEGKKSRKASRPRRP